MLMLVSELARRSDIVGDDDYALVYASHGGHLEVVKYLIEHGANVHAGLRACSYTTQLYLAVPRPDTVGQNNYALKSAVENDHLHIVKCIIDNMILKN